MSSYDDENVETDIFGDLGHSDASENEESKDHAENNEGNGNQDVTSNKKPRGPKKPRNPQIKLNAERLCGPRGIVAIEDCFRDVRLNGKGNERSDLDIVLKRMEHWAHRLFPKLSFDDCIERVEKLGTNRSVQVYLRKIRSGTVDADGVENVSEEALNDENFEPVVNNQQVQKDAFDELLAHYSNPTPVSSTTITEEQQRRIAENKRLAEEKRRSRLLSQANNANCLSPMSTAGQQKSPGTSSDLVLQEKTPETNYSLLSHNDGDEDDVMDIDAILDDIH
nr:EOG090X0AVC [Ilyocryptus agilis]